MAAFGATVATPSLCGPSARLGARPAAAPLRRVAYNARTGRALHVCQADPDLARKLGEKGIQLEGFDGQNAMPGVEFAKKLEERVTGVPQAEDTGLLSVDGTKTEDALELEYDPEGLLGKAEDNLIERRMRMKEAEEEEKQEEEAKAAWEEERQKLLAMRAARVVPENDPAALAQFFFDTELNEMEYECTRCRPQMSPEFFEHLLKEADAAEDAETKDKFMTLHEATSSYVSFLDANAQALAAPADRMKKILEARDKKATILDMVASNEIDTALIALFQTNVNLAKAAGQEEAAVFMEKVMMACKKYACL